MQAPSTAYDTITSESLLEHIKVLSSDEFDGRMPGTVGEEKTLSYLCHECYSMGLLPAAPNGKYLQMVPAQGIFSTPSLQFRFADANMVKLNFPSDYVAASHRTESKVAIKDSEVVFVGYGIVAPEYGWNDYQDVDVKGKTVIILIGDPSRPAPDDPAQLDQSFFKGRSLTYYGRWTYKYEMAKAKGAACALIVHETETAGYGYDVVKESWGKENFTLVSGDDDLLAHGWLALDTARRLFQHSGMNYDRLKATANQRGFKPITLTAHATMTIENKTRTIESHNVIARLEGSDENLRRECILYSAHWDHFGSVVRPDGHKDVFSGAADNASGVATILEIARAFSLMKVKPRRSIVFMFTTLEESNLLGSRHYAEHPSVDLALTRAVINVDIMNVWGRTKKIVSIALGHSSLDEVLEKLAAKQDRSIAPDPEPEKGYFFRSDHLPFLQAGVPSLFFLFPGMSFIGKDPSFETEVRSNYVQNDYHKPTDKVKPDWDLGGMIEDCQLLTSVGLEVANSDTTPQWKDGSEFKRG